MTELHNLGRDESIQLLPPAEKSRSRRSKNLGGNGKKMRRPAAAETTYINSATFAIAGMTCASCAVSITASVNAIPGVESMSVNLLANKGMAVFQRGSSASPDDVLKAIVDAGFDATILDTRQSPIAVLRDGDDASGNNRCLALSGRGDYEVVTLAINAMTCVCGNCAKSIENALLSNEAVASATVNFRTHVVTVKYDSKAIGPRDVMSVISDAGFECELVSEGSTGDDNSSANHINNAIARSLRWQAILSLALATPIFFIMMVVPYAHVEDNALEQTVVGNAMVMDVVSAVLATPIQFYVAWPFYKGAFAALKRRSANMDTLIVLGTSTAYFVSLGNLFHAMAATSMGGEKTDVFFETSALLITFVIIGKYLEHATKLKTGAAITALLSLEAKQATILTRRTSTYGDENGEDDGGWENVDFNAMKEQTIDARLLHRGDYVKVIASATVPCDGVVVSGATAIDESMITGESMPVPKRTGDKVIGGTVNQQGLVVVQALGVGSNSTLRQILRLVDEAQTSKAPVQAVADAISAVFVPTIVAVALLTFFVWLGLVNSGAVPTEWYRPHSGAVWALFFGIAVLVIACPCALGLATPTAVMVGTGVGARRGILIKGGAALQNANNISAVIFDKTGTLTHGRFVVTDTVVAAGEEPKQLVYYAAAVEMGSEHPIGRAIVTHAKEKYPELKLPTNPGDFHAVTGLGVEGVVDGKQVVVGTKALIAQRLGIRFDGVDGDEVERLERQAKTVAVVAVAGAVLGVIAIADSVKEESARTVAWLKAENIQVWMVTGDNAFTAQAVARQVGIDHVCAAALPAAKADKVRELQAKGLAVAVVGDGVNDAPALAQANLGIALGAGTDVAIQTADVVLISSNLVDVVTALHLARRVFLQIKLNYVWALGYNIIGIPVAAGLFYPLLHQQLPPWVAGLAMACSSVSVVLSSLSLNLYRPPRV